MFVSLSPSVFLSSTDRNIELRSAPDTQLTILRNEVAARCN